MSIRARAPKERLCDYRADQGPQAIEEVKRLVKKEKIANASNLNSPRLPLESDG